MHMDNIQILGFRANIDSVGDVLGKINSIKDDGEIIQLLNADSVVSKNHIIHGVNQAFLAFERGENLANDLSVEIVLRCSAQRQISKAFKILGLREGEMNLCAVLIDSKDYTKDLSLLFTRDDDVLIPNEDKLIEMYKNELPAGTTKFPLDRLTWQYNKNAKTGLITLVGYDKNGNQVVYVSDDYAFFTIDRQTLEDNQVNTENEFASMYCLNTIETVSVDNRNFFQKIWDAITGFFSRIFGHEEETERRADGHLMEGVRQHLFPEIVVMVLPQDGRHRRQRRAGRLQRRGGRADAYH